MAADIILPKLGMDMQTGTIMTWYKNEGDPVTKGEPLFELMTDKVNLEVEAEASGVLLKRYYEIGTELPVFTVIGCIGQTGEVVQVPEAVEPISTMKEPGNLSDEDRAALKAMRVSHKEGFSVSQKTIRATPSARRLAADNHINLALVQGSGPKGRIQVEDVTDYLGGNTKVEKTEVPQQKVFEEVKAPQPEVQALQDLKPEENLGMKDALDLTLEDLVAGMGSLEEELNTEPNTVDVMESAVVPQPDQEAKADLPEEKSSIITVSPLAERIAAEENIDIKTIGEGSGPDGRIMKEDVLQAMEKGLGRGHEALGAKEETLAIAEPELVAEAIKPKPVVIAEPEPVIEEKAAAIESLVTEIVAEAPAKEETLEPEVMAPVIEDAAPTETQTVSQYDGKLEVLTPKRRIIAEHMVKSNLENAVITLTAEIDMTEVKDLRKKISKKVEGETGYRCTYTDFLLVSVSRALMEHPYINSALCDEGIVLHDFVHLGLAMGMDDGLVVPVIKNTQGASFSEMVTKRSEMLKLVKLKKLTADHYKGSTFTVTNLGMYGILEFSAIINQPNSAILSVGEVVERVRVIKGEVVPRFIMKISLNLDHRVADGMAGAKFLQTVKGYMENPALLLF